MSIAIAIAMLLLLVCLMLVAAVPPGQTGDIAPGETSLLLY
jgi:hypothetical protein